jgi:hypothetical protein
MTPDRNLGHGRRGLDTGASASEVATANDRRAARTKDGQRLFMKTSDGLLEASTGRHSVRPHRASPSTTNPAQ